MNHNKKYLPRGIVDSIAKHLGISKQAVYHRLKRNHEPTIDLLCLEVQNYFKKQTELKHRIQLKMQSIREQLDKFNEFS